MKYVCIHGHFYQPPRENPYLEAVELQDSAYPYHDWNERITAECYAPNAASRILDSENRITKLRQQLCAHQLQLRPYAAFVDERTGAHRLSVDPRGRSAEPRKIFRVTVLRSRRVTTT